jgi:sarcosine oxidase, subunit beta
VRAEALSRAADLQRSLGVETEWLSTDDIAARAPIVRVEGLVGGTYHARDGYLDPHGLLTVLERDARARGAVVEVGAEVAALARSGDGFELTAGGRRHRAAWVVNAAGAHARTVAALLDVDVPVEPVRRNLAYLHDATATPSPAWIPMCVDLDTGVLVRREGEGYVIAYSDPDDRPGWETTLDPRFLPAVAQRIGNRFPSLEGQPIHPRHCWAGLYPETPDGHAIVGSEPSVPGFIHCAGFGGHGLMHSPAAGKAVAELIASGRCDSFDLHPLRPTRFEEGDLVRETAVL